LSRGPSDAVERTAMSRHFVNGPIQRAGGSQPRELRCKK
jgi:hypothetical protein